MIHIGESRQPAADGTIAARARGARRPGGPKVATPAEPAAAAEAIEAKPPPQTIGVVCVHGVGDQRPGDTLLSWARALERVVTAWKATTVGVAPGNDPVEDANIDFSGASRPFIRLDIPEVPAADTRSGSPHPAQVWYITEAWWASHVKPPTVGQMFRWLVPNEMWRIVFGIFTGIGGESGRLARYVDAVLLTLFVVPGTLLALAVYLVFRVMQVIPNKKVQEFAGLKALQFFLADWFGDVRVLLTDRAQAANIRSCVAASIQDCVDAGCDTIVVIGHSGGTMVGYMTLTDPAFHELPVKRFITHGQALGLAWRLGHVDEYTVPDRNQDHLYQGDRLRMDLAETERAEKHGLQWWDFWGTHDPACGGGLSQPVVTRPERVNGGESTRVFNRMSLRNDHGAYWDNDEEFVLPVASLIELAPGGAPGTRFFPERHGQIRKQRRHARVKLLQAAWFGVMASALAAVALALGRLLLQHDGRTIERAGVEVWAALSTLMTQLGLAFDFFQIGKPDLPPVSGTPAVLVGVAALLVAYWAIGRTMASLWNRWDRRERQIALQPIPGWRSRWLLVVQLGLCAGASIMLWTVAWLGDWLFVGPSIIALALAVGTSLIGDRGCVRRPSHDEAAAADVLPA